MYKWSNYKNAIRIGYFLPHGCSSGIREMSHEYKIYRNTVSSPRLAQSESAVVPYKHVNRTQHVQYIWYKNGPARTWQVCIDLVSALKEGNIKVHNELGPTQSST